MIFNLVFNITIATLLVFCIFYCYRLSVKLKNLRNSNGHLITFIKQFDDSSSKVEFALSEIKNLKSSINLFSKEVQKASMVSGDLSILSNKAEKIADKLEEMIEKDFNELNKIRNIYVKETEEFSTQETLPIFKNEPISQVKQVTSSVNVATIKIPEKQEQNPKTRKILIEEALKQISKKMGK
jgi:hypothetical protein